jgi:hypothetical protein
VAAFSRRSAGLVALHRVSKSRPLTTRRKRILALTPTLGKRGRVEMHSRRLAGEEQNTGEHDSRAVVVELSNQGKRKE